MPFLPLSAWPISFLWLLATDTCGKWFKLAKSWWQGENVYVALGSMDLFNGKQPRPWALYLTKRLISKNWSSRACLCWLLYNCQNVDPRYIHFTWCLDIKIFFFYITICDIIFIMALNIIIAILVCYMIYYFILEWYNCLYYFHCIIITIVYFSF